MKDNTLQVVEAVREMDGDVLAFQEVPLPGGFGYDEGTAFAELMASLGPPTPEARGALGNRLLWGLRDLGYEHCTFAPSFMMNGFMPDLDCEVFGNAVFSRRPLGKGRGPANRAITLDLNRDGHYDGVPESCSRSAALMLVPMGSDSSEVEPLMVAVASLHLDVLVELGAYFGVAEGDMIRLLEFEALHHACRDLANLVVVGDFNSPSSRCSNCSPAHKGLALSLERLSFERDPKAYRHKLPLQPGGLPRLPEELGFTALGFAEQTLGYCHCWELGPGLKAPLYSHWSGQLIDHGLIRDKAWTGEKGQSVEVKATFVGKFHTDASDHLPLIIDLELTPTPQSLCQTAVREVPVVFANRSELSA